MPANDDVSFLSANGMKLAVSSVGSGDQNSPHLVWLHGLGAASTRTFRDVARHPALAGITSLLIDLPGHGKSEGPADWSYSIEEMADVVAAGLVHVVDEPSILFGHSMGGSVAIAATTQFPAQFSQLIVAEPNLDPGVGTTSVWIAQQSESQFVDSGYRRLVEGTRRLARQGNRDAAAWLPSLMEAHPQALHRSATSLLASRTPTFREMLQRLSLPVALITGDLSNRSGWPMDDTPRLRGYVVPDAGHQMFDNNPNQFVSILADIIEPEKQGRRTR